MLQGYRVENFIHPDIPKITLMRKDADELISELNNIRSLIHRQLKQLEISKRPGNQRRTLKMIWSGLVVKPSCVFLKSSKTFT